MVLRFIGMGTCALYGVLHVLGITIVLHHTCGVGLEWVGRYMVDLKGFIPGG